MPYSKLYIKILKKSSSEEVSQKPLTFSEKCGIVLTYTLLI